MESIYLRGSEDVQRAGSNMVSAAETMKRAADSIDESLRNHRNFMDDWLLRFQDLLEGIKR